MFPHPAGIDDERGLWSGQPVEGDDDESAKISEVGTTAGEVPACCRGEANPRKLRAQPVFSLLRPLTEP